MISQPAGTFGPPRSAPAGWYPDPYGSVYARYYDGYRWTPYVAAPGAVATSAPHAEEPHPELPFPMAIGAIAILAASLIASREVLDSLIDRDWNIVVYMLHRRRRRLRAVGGVDVVRQRALGDGSSVLPTSACASAGSTSAGGR